MFGLIVPELEAWLGFRVVPAYGMTETVIHATNDNPGRMVPKGSMGKPTPGYELIIVDRDTGEICDDGRPGELWVRGTRGIQLFLEYYDNPEAMAKSFTPDGWFKTGDVVRLAEGGNFVYCDRDGDVLRSAARTSRPGRWKTPAARSRASATWPWWPRATTCCRRWPWPSSSRVPGRRPTTNARDRHHRGVRSRTGRLQGPPGRLLGGRVPRATLDKVAKNKLRDLADETVAATTA